MVTRLTEEQLAEAYDFLKKEITVIEPPELDLEAIRKALVGAYEDWDGSKWPKGLLDKIRGM